MPTGAVRRIPVGMEYTDNDFEPQALAALRGNRPIVFLTGKAGTGKSTLITYWLAHGAPRNTVMIAPTGIAALNLPGGTTVHRFIHAKPGVTPDEAATLGRRWGGAYHRAIETVVLDEVSMVRADLMDCLDRFLKAARRSNRPFGGVRLVLVGDLMQLPPVVDRESEPAFSGDPWAGPWFFQSHVMDKALKDGRVGAVELGEVHRQSDPEFIGALNLIRDGIPDPGALDTLNARAPRHYDPNTMGHTVVLAAYNRQADMVNTVNLNRLDGPSMTSAAETDGKWDPRLNPAPPRLDLRVGMRVMMLANATDGMYANGSMGTLEGFEEGLPVVLLDDGGVVTVGRHAWEITRSVLTENPETGERRIESVVVGSYRQLPMAPGWAITVHKSQGKSFDSMHLVLPDRPLFADGQAYVALSRARGLEGLTMTRPLIPADVHADPQAAAFTERIRGGAPAPAVQEPLF